MDNIANTVKEKMQKTYSFTGTQLIFTAIGLLIFAGCMAYIGEDMDRHHEGSREMMMGRHMKSRGDRNHDMDDGPQDERYNKNNDNRSPENNVLRGEQIQSNKTILPQAVTTHATGSIWSGR